MLSSDFHFHSISTVNYPDTLASVVFFQGCNLQCGYCHNHTLAQAETLTTIPTLDKILVELEKRQKFIDGVVVTGGEPTLHPELVTFIQYIKKLGLKVKLDTNGLRPNILQQLLTLHLVDMISLDLKTSPHKYHLLNGTKSAEANLKCTLKLLHSSQCRVEYRTTCVPTIVNLEDIQLLSTMLFPTDTWYLQKFIAQNTLNPKFSDVHQRESYTYSKDEMEQLISCARKRIPNTNFR